MNILKAYNFVQVNEVISCSGLLKNINLQSLSGNGYEVVINLLPDDDQHATDGEKESIEKMGIRYIHIPIDWDKPTHSDFELFKSSMDSTENKKYIYIVQQTIERLRFMPYTHIRGMAGLVQS